MKFDIKDVKSWANRHDVKVGDDGYVSSDINTLQDDLKSGIAQIRIICHVRDDDVECFSCKAFGAIRNYGFFLPVDAVKEDKLKEKKYRRFEDLYEFYKFLSFLRMASVLPNELNLMSYYNKEKQYFVVYCLL